MITGIFLFSLRILCFRNWERFIVPVIAKGSLFGGKAIGITSRFKKRLGFWRYDIKNTTFTPSDLYNLLINSEIQI